MDQQSGDSISVREIYSVMDHLRRAGTQPDWATASRRISYELGCEVWSLSPDDHAYTSFLKTSADVTRSRRGTAVPWPLSTPNTLSVALLVTFGPKLSCLRGADLERHGWEAIIRDDRRPRRLSSVFKVPHHGSATADLDNLGESARSRSGSWRRSQHCGRPWADCRRTIRC